MRIFREDWALHLDAVVERWLGYTRPSVRRVLADAVWGPDDAAMFCPRCGVSVGPGEASGSGCGSCRDTRPVVDRVFRLGAYQDPLRQWILDVKYQAWAEMATALGRQLGERLATEHGEGEGEALIVPLPMAWARRVHRGIDHAAMIATGVANEFGAPVLRVFERRLGEAQVTLPRSRRRRGGTHGMRLRTWAKRRPVADWIRGADVVLVDDVLTTGATLKAASRLLRPLKPRTVVAAVLAVSDDPARRRGGPPEELIDDLNASDSSRDGDEVEVQ